MRIRIILSSMVSSFGVGEVFVILATDCGRRYGKGKGEIWEKIGRPGPPRFLRNRLVGCRLVPVAKEASMKTHHLVAMASLLASCAASAADRPFPLAPTGQRSCYDVDGYEMACAARNAPLGGQDAFYAK